MPGLFLAACFISMAVGTSVGTVVALTPVAMGIAGEIGGSIPMFVAVVVGGSFFGDNLSLYQTLRLPPRGRKAARCATSSTLTSG